MIAPVIANSQSFSVPISILDSLLWGYERGISCDSLRVAQANLIKSQGAELIVTGKLLEVEQSKSDNLEQRLANQKEGRENDKKQADLNLRDEKRKVKKWRRISVLESIGVIVGIIILL